jgi:hypothetical protein
VLESAIINIVFTFLIGGHNKTLCYNLINVQDWKELNIEAHDCWGFGQAYHVIG